jgi:F-type H+-transporting ATPase subunit delta
VKETTVGRKYALALFNAARSRGALDAVADDVTSLQELVRTDARLIAFLGAPDIPDDRKSAFVKTVLGARVSPLTLELLELLVRKGRLPVLSQVLATFQDLTLEARGIVRVQTVTAVKLSEAERASLVDKLQKLTRKTVRMTESLDPRILGGVVVKMGGKVIDGSVRTALDTLKKALLAAPLQKQ